jgi:type II secretory pathway component PulF
MPNFRYKASNSAGKMMNGVIEADSPADAQRRLSGRGLRPVQVQLAVLPKPRRFALAPAEGPRWGLWLASILALLAAGGAALWWFDPLHWFGR